MTYYVKEGQSSFYRDIKFYEEECQISFPISNIKKIEKVVKKMKKKNIKQVILSKEIKQNLAFTEMLNNYDITMFDGKWLMQYILQDIINYLKEKHKLSISDEITILANDLTNEVKQNIIRFASIYKKIRIITNHLERFKRIEEELYEKNGIPIIITNNKRKALAKAKLIVNFDFVQETIDQYNVYENATIINLNEKIRINKKRFNGLIITDYEVEFQNFDEEYELDFWDLEDILKKQKEFSLKEILEEKIYSNIEKKPNYMIFTIVQDIIKKYHVEVKELYGINGVLS